MNDFALVSPNGDSSGRFMNIKPYATIFTMKPNATTAEWLNPLDSMLLDVFLPKILNKNPPIEKKKNNNNELWKLLSYIIL